MAENIELEVSGFQSLKAQLKEAQVEAQKMAQEFGISSDQAKAAARAAAEIKDQLDDVNDSVSAFTGAGKIQAFTKGLTAVSGGFTAIQGAIGLVNDDTKEFEKTIQKLQSAMALTQGLAALEDLGNSFTNIGKIGTQAFGAIKKAIGGTGIGLLIVAIGTLYANWDKLKKLVTDTFPILKDTEGMFEKIQQVAFGVGNVILKYVVAPFKALGSVLSGEFKQALNDLKEGVDIANNYQEGVRKEQLSQAQEHLKKRIEQQTKANEKYIEIQKAAGKDTYELEKKNLAEKAKLYTDDDKESKEKREELFQQMRVLDATHQKKVADDNKKAADEAANKAKEAADKRKEILKTGLQAEQDAIVAANKVRRDEQENELAELSATYSKRIEEAEKAGLATNRIMEAYKIEEAAIIKKYDDKAIEEQKKKDAEEIARKKELATALAVTDQEKHALEIQSLNDQYDEIAKKSQGHADELVAIEDARKKAIKASDDKYYADQEQQKIDRQDKEIEDLGTDFDAKYAILDQQRQEIISNTNLTEEKRTQLLKQNSDARKKIEAAEIEYKADVADKYLDVVSKLGSFLGQIAGKNKALAKTAVIIEKAAAIGQIIASTAIANAKAVAASPLTGGMPWVAVNTAAAAVSSASTVLAGVKAIQEIDAQNTDSKSDSESSTTEVKPSKFAKGGLLMGRKHAEGGIMTPFGELEGGEFVINRMATADYLPLLEAINSQGSGSGPNNNTSVATEMNNRGSTPIVKAYVVASEMTNQQEADAKIKRLARI